MNRARERIPAAILALGLQGLFLALLLHAFPLTAPRPLLRETLFLLPRLIEKPPPPPPAPRIIDARPPATSRPAPPIVVAPPQITAPAAPAPPSQADIQALGRALFNCAPENYGNLPPEQRAHCTHPGEGMAMNQPPNLMGTRSHVKDEAYWQEELAREQSPTMLPCMGGLNLLCVLKMIATGDFSQIGDPHKWPRYDVTRIPPEDFKKIEEAYDAWHKAHREASRDRKPDASGKIP
jgi:hypothetical protein